MAVSAAQVTVTNTPTALNTASQDGTYLNIRNGTGGVIALGPSNVAIATGMTVPVSTNAPTIFLKPGDVLFGFCTTSSVVEVLRT